jgi:hypothetical protein
MREAREMSGRIKSKYPEIDISSVGASLKEQYAYDDDPLLMSIAIGGPSGGRSIVKSALGLAVKHGIEAESCAPALNYLRGAETSPPFGYYYQRDLVSGRSEERVFNSVAIQGDRSSGLLVGYVEYFSAFRMLVLLSDRFSGPDINEHYALDPTNGERLALDFDLKLSRDELEATFRYERVPEQAIVAGFEGVMRLSQTRGFEREKDRVIANAIEYAFNNCGAQPGEAMTAQHASTISALVIESMQPFLRRHATGRIPPHRPLFKF